jgi:hypothetical protein
VAAMYRVNLQMGKTDDGRMLAIIYREEGDDIIVLDVEVVETETEGVAWFNVAAVERPWESRQ